MAVYGFGSEAKTGRGRSGLSRSAEASLVRSTLHTAQPWASSFCTAQHDRILNSAHHSTTSRLLRYDHSSFILGRSRCRRSPDLQVAEVSITIEIELERHPSSTVLLQLEYISTCPEPKSQLFSSCGPALALLMASSSRQGKTLRSYR
jgi:hypothetical protein